ncbi:hypothetical protein AB0C28_32505 [Nonomuraea sp. NPDC048892]|uniref:hypothetical protein n=2 Tax=unclassified Nonomuraea TaxID=2593643 RepID=UPI0033FDA2ED
MVSGIPGALPARRPKPNAICVGGPCDGMLTHIEQDVGVVRVRLKPDLQTRGVRYRITAGRVHHPSCNAPFVVLSWAGDDAGD